MASYDSTRPSTFKKAAILYCFLVFLRQVLERYELPALESPLETPTLLASGLWGSPKSAQGLAISQSGNHAVTIKQLNQALGD